MIVYPLAGMSVTQQLRWLERRYEEQQADLRAAREALRELTEKYFELERYTRADALLLDNLGEME